MKPVMINLNCIPFLIRSLTTICFIDWELKGLGNSGLRHLLTNFADSSN